MAILQGLIETIDPKRGNGKLESIIFLLLVVGVLFLNYKGIEVNQTVDFIVKGFVGFMLGFNTNKALKEISEKVGEKNEQE